MLQIEGKTREGFRGYLMERELTRREYERLVETAKRMGNERLELLVQTICATGIRVSEVRAVTVESLRRGQAEIRSKGRIRIVLLPKKLCGVLAAYCRRRGYPQGERICDEDRAAAGPEQYLEDDEAAGRAGAGGVGEGVSP